MVKLFRFFTRKPICVCYLTWKFIIHVMCVLWMEAIWSSRLLPWLITPWYHARVSLLYWFYYSWMVMTILMFPASKRYGPLQVCNFVTRKTRKLWWSGHFTNLNPMVWYDKRILHILFMILGKWLVRWIIMFGWNQTENRKVFRTMITSWYTWTIYWLWVINLMLL